MNQTRLAAYLLLIWMEKNEMKWNKTRSNKKKHRFSGLKFLYSALWSAWKRKNKAQEDIDRVLRIWCMIQPQTLSQCETTGTQRVRSFFIALCTELQSFLLCVCYYCLLLVGVCVNVLFFNQEYVSHTTMARRSVNHWALLHGWKINCIEYITHVVLSLIHICIRFGVS